MSYFKILNFSGGLNTLFNAQILAPNAEGEPAEFQEIENMDITSNGSVVTSPGYSLVSSGVALTGGTKDLLVYEKTPSERWLVIAHDDDYYEVDPADFTWTSVGDYGTAATNVGGVVYKGTSSTRRAILGNSESANTTKKWDGTTFANLGGSPPDGWIMEEWMGRLFIASGASLYYSDVEDEDDFAGGGVISFNDYISGVKAQGEFLIVYTRKEAYAVQFYYNDAFSLSAPLKKPFKNSSGCLAHKTAQRVYNDIYAFSDDGVQRFGADAQFIGQNLRINSLSWKINPSLSVSQAVINAENVERSCAAYFQKRYFMAVPYGSSSTNNQIFVYNYDFDAWTTRSGIYPSNFAIMANSTNKDELYFASNLEASLYKFANVWDYNGAGYTRAFKLKKFTMGNAMATKNWNFIDIRGAKYIGTKFRVDITVDGTTKTYEITDDNLEASSSGGYYGDDYLGENYYGGAFAGSFKRYGARLPFPYEVRQGREMEIRFYNSAAGQPWSVDFVGIDFTMADPVKIPTNYQNTTLIS